MSELGQNRKWGPCGSQLCPKNGLGRTFTEVRYCHLQTHALQQFLLTVILEAIVLEKREQSRNLTGASFDSKFDCAIKETKSTFLLRGDRTFVRIDRGPRATGSLWVLAPSIDCRLVRLTPVMGLHRRIDVRSSPISLWQKTNPPEGGFFASSRSTIGIDRDEPLLPYRKSEMRQG